MAKISAYPQKGELKEITDSRFGRKLEYDLNKNLRNMKSPNVKLPLFAKTKNNVFDM